MTINGKKNDLPSVSADEYGDAYRDHLLEQYKLYVESANRISDRRATANTYFLTINTSLVTLYALATSFAHNPAWHVAAVAVPGILLCTTWFILIRSYRDLNAAKFAVIHHLERELPTALFTYEWTIAEEGKGKTYKPLSHIEQYIPLIFFAVYVALTLFVVFAPPVSKPSPSGNDATTISIPLEQGGAQQE